MIETVRHAYFTLVENDPWVIGALVLGHSLRRNGTTARLVCQVGSELSDESMARLALVYDVVEAAPEYLFPASKFNSMSEVPEKLAFSFRRLNAWKRTEYDRIIYLDSDLVVMKNIDVLFAVPGVAAPREFDFRVWRHGRTYTDFFNGGMVSFSPSQAIFHRFAETLVEQWVYLGAAEQHLVNVVCQDNWFRVPNFFHVQAGAWQHSYLSQKPEDIGALHFSKISKPWDTRYTGRESLWRPWCRFAAMWANWLRDYETEYSDAIMQDGFLWETARKQLEGGRKAKYQVKNNSPEKSYRELKIVSQSPKKIAEIAVFKGAFQKISELGKLITLLKKRKLRRIVEIGTYRGGTLWVWCQLATDDAHIVSIDLPAESEVGRTGQAGLKRFAKHTQRLEFIRSDSNREKTRDRLVGVLDGDRIDFLFIDGDHRYESVRRDFELYGPLVRPGGIVAFHDIIRPPAFPDNQVYRYWNELRKDYRVKEYLDPSDERGWGEWGGIGVLYMR